MTEKITAYLCERLLGEIEYEAYGQIDVTEVANQIITTALWPENPAPGCQDQAGKICASLSEVQGSLAAWAVSPLTCKEDQDALTWERQEITFDGSPVGLKDFITVNVRNAAHCQWIWSGLVVFGADLSMWGRTVFWVDVGSGDSPCPENKDDVFSGGGTSVYSMTQNQIVPGELMNLVWRFWDGQHTEEITVDAKWFCTCCFTGGEVMAISGGYGNIDIEYTVKIQGVEKTCVPSDFVEYEVGDWVFVGVPNSVCAECGRTSACKQGCEEAAKYVILPLGIGSYGA